MSVKSAAPIRVLYCIERMLHGGTEKQLAALLRGLDRSVVEPALCTLRPSPMNLSDLGCEVIELDFRSLKEPRALACIHRLRRFIMDRRIEVVHTFFQDPTVIGVLASLRTTVHVRVMSFRDMGFWRTPLKVAQVRAAYRFLHGFIANSKAVAERVHELDGIPRNEIEIIYNGVSMPDASPANDGQPRFVGAVSNLDRPVKRIDLFLEVARLVRDAVPSAQFMVLGDGPLLGDLQEQARRLGVAEAVHFMGSQADSDRYVRRFAVGVVCSDSEGLSNATLECMARGVPAVARRVGGNGELVQDGVTGRLVDTDRPEPLANAVIELLQNESLRQSMGERARAHVKAQHSMDGYVRSHEQYYARMLARYGRAVAVPTKVVQA